MSITFSTTCQRKSCRCIRCTSLLQKVVHTWYGYLRPSAQVMCKNFPQAIMALEFIDRYGTNLQGDLKKLDLAWSQFLTTSKWSGEPFPQNELSQLIQWVSSLAIGWFPWHPHQRSVTLIQPSLPSPSGIAKWLLPRIYKPRDHKRCECVVMNLRNNPSNLEIPGASLKGWPEVRRLLSTLICLWFNIL